MKKKLIFTILCFLFTFSLLAQQRQNDKVIKVGVENGIDIISPWETISASTTKIFWNVVEPLVTLEENSTKIKPYLATS